MFRGSSVRTSISAVGLLGLAVAVIGAKPAATGPQPGGQRAASPLAPDKYKNIQVLTDVPADRLLMTMNYVAAATGLRCGDCHVQDSAAGIWAPEKDDKRLKLRAREMMRMVKAINADHFGVTVGCATCHQGRNRPAGLQVALPLAPGRTSTGTDGAARDAPGEAQGPSVDEVLSRYVEALGGRAALEHLQSRAISGSITSRTGQTAAVTIEQKGDRYRETTDTPSSPLVRAFDGTAAWATVGGHTTDLAVFEQTIRVPDLTLALHLKDLYPALQSVRPARLEGRDVNILRGRATDVTETLYFDAASGLLVRRAISTSTPLGPLPWQVDYADYRDVAGVRMPFKITRSNWQAIDTLKVADIRPNVPIDDARFAKPTS